MRAFSQIVCGLGVLFLASCGAGGGGGGGDDGALPDLVVAHPPGAGRHYYAESQRQPGLLVYVTNVGRGTSPVVAVDVEYQTEHELYGHTVSTGGEIPPGGTQTVLVPLPAESPADLWITIDVDDRVRETSELNNDAVDTYPN